MAQGSSETENADAVKERDALGKTMKAADLTLARKLAVAWKMGASIEVESSSAKK